MTVQFFSCPLGGAAPQALASSPAAKMADVERINPVPPGSSPLSMTKSVAETFDRDTARLPKWTQPSIAQANPFDTLLQVSVLELTALFSTVESNTDGAIGMGET
ncbi:hypothetical protein LPN01_18225 [Sphingomonas sp. A2-49]|uniref:hypothetical protein n=1 Tax=Sphingomonas sp. A2-49 TaxID=1391375 RepID=UPI0021D1C672|nr:hypothetical protein [Sphingomonas sp. A2-49]MCU6456018.1 hypothetical protein [Sphingomonas sp. A2-49]